MSSTSSLFRAGFLAPVAVATVFCLAAPVNAAPVSVNWSCRGTIFGIGQTSSMNTSVTGTAPGSAASGSAVAITITPGASSVPSSASGFTVNNISNLKMTIPTPANSTLVSATASGGTVAGSAGIRGYRPKKADRSAHFVRQYWARRSKKLEWRDTCKDVTSRFRRRTAARFAHT